MIQFYNFFPQFCGNDICVKIYVFWISNDQCDKYHPQGWCELLANLQIKVNKNHLHLQIQVFIASQIFDFLISLGRSMVSPLCRYHRACTLDPRLLIETRDLLKSSRAPMPYSVGILGFLFRKRRDKFLYQGLAISFWLMLALEFPSSRNLSK